MSGFEDRICCPRCRSKLRPAERVTDPATDAGKKLICSNTACAYSADGFFSERGQPVLVDFERSIFSPDDILARNGDAIHWRPRVSGIKPAVMRIFFGENKTAERYCREMIKLLHERTAKPRILVIGGGSIGSGLQKFYTRDDVEIVGTDVYASSHTRLLADGHSLPFDDESFDGVVIQAVLEHVLDPPVVVAEIHRVLKPDGLVYADTPFMQQVHAGAYDFTRFTVSGHRWLFRNFALMSAGASGGVGTACIWSVKYFVRSLTGSNKLGTGASMLFFWLRFIDTVTQRRLNNDAACGVYFFGSKAKTPIAPRDMVNFYESQAV